MRRRERKRFGETNSQNARSSTPSERNSKKAAAPSIPCFMPSLVRSVALLSYLRWKKGVSEMCNEQK
jgi:hypothetical protein